jgi:hypothetical protein
MFTRQKSGRNKFRAAALIGLLTAGACIACLQADGATADSASGTTAPGTWQDHSYQFQYLGVTATYSCQSLADKLRYLLQLAGARDVHATPVCARTVGVPDRSAQVNLSFRSLAPSESASASGSPVPGVWQPVLWAPRNPHNLAPDDCELIQQFRQSILPMLATRNVRSNTACVAYQELGGFRLSFDVFAPVAAATSR